jgi:carboxylesterase
MPEHVAVTPDPFYLTGGSSGVLMIHGFTGSASEMRPVANYLHEHGFTVSAPLLPGHGTTAEDLNGRHWQEWYEAAEAALLELCTKCNKVFICGQSMGGALTLNLAAHHGDKISGAILYAPAIYLTDRMSILTPLARYLIKTLPKGPDDFVDKEALSLLWSYDVNPIGGVHELLKLIRQTQKILPRVTCPLLIVHSTEDRTIQPRSAQAIYDRVSSTDKEVIMLHKCGHVISLDAEWERVAALTHSFIARLVEGAVHVPVQVGLSQQEAK